MKYYVGIDMGTQSMRGYLFDPEGELVAQASSEYLPVYPQAGWAECDANLWLDALGRILTQIKEQGRITAEDIGTIAFACIDASIVPVDENCIPIDNCIIWMDSRTGRIQGENCWGPEKVERLRQVYPQFHMSEFYSDSRSDTPLAQVADRAFLVKGDELLPW